MQFVQMLMILLVGSVITEDAVNVLESKLELETTRVGNKTGKYYGLKVFSADGDKKKGNEFDMLPLFNYSNVLLGDKTKFKWGIDCTEENECTPSEDTPEEHFFMFVMYHSKKATSELRLYKTQKLETDKTERLEANLIVDSVNTWIPETGVLGLAPNGTFADYLRKNFGDTSLLFHYDDSQSYDYDQTFVTNVVLNPEIKDDNIYASIEVPQDTDSWVIQGSVQAEGSTLDAKNQQICITNIDDNIILAPSNMHCDSIQKLACGETGKTCTKNRVDMEKVPDLVITLGEGEPLVFKPEEYVYFDKEGVLSCRFGDPGALRSMELCGKNGTVEYAIGNRFFQKVFPALTYKKDGSASLKFLKTYDFDSKKLNGGYLLFYIIGGVVLLIILVCVIVVLRRKGDEEEEYEAVQE